MARVVVVGAGVGGLTAAIRLVATGHSVTLCEANTRVGGKLGCHERTTAAGTFRFDVGPTLFTLPQVFRDLFAATGAPLESVVTLRPLDPIARYRFADGTTVETTTDLARQSSLFDAALGPGTGAAWQRVLDRGRAIWTAVEEPVFGQPLSAGTAVRLLRRLRHLEDVRAVAPGRTLRGLARALLSDPRQRLLLERYATYAGSDPRRAPAALAAIPYLEQAYGAWYVAGGLHRLAGALGDRFAELGGDLRLAARVERVEAAAGRVSSVALGSGERLAADVVVCNADAASLYGRLLPEPRRRVPPADSLSGFVLMLGLRGRSRDPTHHYVLFGNEPYDAEFDAVFGRPARPVRDPALYVNAPDDPATAPPGHEAWHVLANAPRHGVDGAPGTVDWSAPGVVDRYAKHLLTLLAARGLPVADRLVFCDIRSPLDLERDTLSPGGAIYGRVLHGPVATLRRPANRSRVRGLFLVGGSSHPGGGLPLVAMSGRLVAEVIGPA